MSSRIACSWSPRSFIFSSFFQLIGAGCCVAVAIFIVINRNRPLPFCSENVSYGDGCLPCSEHGTCRSGKMTCHPGYRRVEKMCVESADYKEEVAKLSDEIGKYIASKVNSDCVTTELVPQHEIEEHFGGRVHFNSALRQVSKTRYQIEESDGYFSAGVPFDFKCSVLRFADENRGDVAMIGFVMTFALTITISVLRRWRTRQAIERYAASIIDTLARDRTNKFHSASNFFKAIETNTLHNYWNDIIRRVEGNCEVEAVRSSSGQKWRFAQHVMRFQ